MTKSLPVRTRRRNVFLRHLASGRTVADACEAAELAWSTLYYWRRSDDVFRAEWDKAARHGEDALAARFDSALVRRAVDGVEEKVFHAGEEVGTRTRYSDPLLMFGIRDLRERRKAPEPVVLPPAGTSKVTVVIEPYVPFKEKADD